MIDRDDLPPYATSPGDDGCDDGESDPVSTGDACPDDAPAPPLLDLRSTLEILAECSDERALWSEYDWVLCREAQPFLHSRFALFTAADASAFLDGESAWDMDAVTRAHGLRSYLDAAAFADVLVVQKRQVPRSTLADFAAALQHYAEFDTVLGPRRGSSTEPAPELASGPFWEYDLHATCASSTAAATLAPLLPPGAAPACVDGAPVKLATRVDRERRDRLLQVCLAAPGLQLEVVAYPPFAWQTAATRTSL